jgi:ABC-type nitrate/sulfonate/bicarbonate transport system substrate-binding protein
MSILELTKSRPAHSGQSELREIWFTRCPVPTATGLAYKLGWLSEEFARDDIRIAAIQDAPRELARHHYDHEIPTLIREGGSLLALAARAQGAPTRLIGLTWIDEAQAIIVRADSNIRAPADLKGCVWRCRPTLVAKFPRTCVGPASPVGCLFMGSRAHWLLPT